MKMNRKLKVICFALVGFVFSPLIVQADAIIADIVPKQDFQERVQVPQEERREAVSQRGDCLNARLSPGVTVWFFEEEDTEVGPALYLDVFCETSPWNFRVGVEGAHIGLTQENAESIREFTDKEARITYIRIPFAVEYVTQVAENTNFFVGGGPDIVHTANDNSDTSVGGHLGARLGYAFTDNWGISVEGGYMWGKVNTDDGGDLKLDGAYVSPLLTYTF